MAGKYFWSLDMAVFLSPVGGAAAQFFDNNGNPLTGGKLFTYSAGTTTPAASYTSSSGNVAHTNPIILDSAGRVPGGEIWLDGATQYKFVLKTSADVLIATYDNVWGIGAAGGSEIQTPVIFNSTGNGTTVAFTLVSAPTSSSRGAVRLTGPRVTRRSRFWIGI